LRNLADAVAPEKLPAIALTAAPVNASLWSGSMQLTRWSSLATWAKISRPQTAPATPAKAPIAAATPQMNFGAVLSAPTAKAPVKPAHLHGHKLKNKLGRSRM